jgi:hypothetical protein
MQGALSPACAIVAFEIWVPSSYIPAIRVVRKEEGRRSYSLSSASADRDAAHLSKTGAISSAEDANSP